MPKLPPVKRFEASNGVRVYRIPCQVFDYLSARVYLLLGAGPPTLVDAGSGQGESTAQILAGLKTVRTEFGESVRPGDVKRILITHSHTDHIGGLWDLLKKMDAEIGVHPLDSLHLTSPEERSVFGNRRMRTFLHHAGVDPTRIKRLVEPRFGRLKRPGLSIDIPLTDGLQLDGLKFVHTPGHSPGLVCTIVGDVLLSADHILARTVSQLWPESLTPHTGMEHYFDSLEKVAAMGGFDIALASHEPVIKDVYRRIDAIRASHLRRLDRIVDILTETDHPLSLAEIAERMYVRATGFRGLLALCDVGARVEYLHQHSRVAMVNLDEIEAESIPVYRYLRA